MKKILLTNFWIHDPNTWSTCLTFPPSVLYQLVLLPRLILQECTVMLM
jgi:hypothetical protein